MTEYALTDADGTVRWRGTLVPAPGSSLPSQWVIDPDGTLNIDVGGFTRVSLTADGKLNLYRADGTIAAQASAAGPGVGVVRVFDAAELVMSNLDDAPVILGESGGAGQDGGPVILRSGAGDAGAGSHAQITIGAGTGAGADGDITVLGGVMTVDGASIRFKMPEMGFFDGAPQPRPTGVPVDAAGIHAALVTLGLITA